MEEPIVNYVYVRIDILYSMEYIIRVMRPITNNTATMTIKEFYVQNFPTDNLGQELNETATFMGLLKEMVYGGDIYKYIGVGDSLIRERLFWKLSKDLNVSYNEVWDLWLD